MKRTSLIASALFGAVVGFASVASASVVELFPLQSLADYSSFVVRGKVVSTVGRSGASP
mgnify:CR=1 FL=1